MRRHKIHPLAHYSSYVMEYDPTDYEERARDEEYRNLFFGLREQNSPRLKAAASELLKRKTLVNVLDGVTFRYTLHGKKFLCATSPTFSKLLDNPILLAPFGWRKSSNIQTLCDRILDCEVRVRLKYSMESQDTDKSQGRI